MGDLFYFNFSGKNVLFRVIELRDHYFSGEFQFPYQFKMDYFSETENFTEYGFNKILYQLIENIYLALDDLIENVEELKKDIENIQLDHKKLEVKKDDFLPLTIEKYIEARSQYYIHLKWGEILKNQVIDAFFKLLSRQEKGQIKMAESEYDEFFKKIIYKYKRYTEISAEGEKFYNYTLIERFLLETGHVNLTLKQTGRGRHNIPEKFIEICDQDQYFRKEENKLPLIIGTQFGTWPKISEEFNKKMEGKKAAILSRSALSGYEHSLSLVIFKDGKYTTLLKVIS
ncbi:MAG TPA: hypothetical protein PK076_11425 [Saprospiraceae bacterium]|nr:hypothetical protein [Saprospiraceae bacterium]